MFPIFLPMYIYAGWYGASPSARPMTPAERAVYDDFIQTNMFTPYMQEHSDMPDLASQLQHAIDRERANDAEIQRTNAENRDLRIEIASKDQTIAELKGEVQVLQDALTNRDRMLSHVQATLNERTAELQEVRQRQESLTRDDIEEPRP